MHLWWEAIRSVFVLVRVTTTAQTLSISATTADSASVALAAIETYSTDWYFIATEDRTSQFVTAMRDYSQIEKLLQGKQ
ncbi:tail sheath protein [Shigella phage vB_SflM_004]|nr:tail sheath protein [Shigella phage vB_SflM_004]